MGGPGSGRWPANLGGKPRKETTEDYFHLDIREIKRHGLIDPCQQELPGVARIEWITSGFGAPTSSGCYLRPWFLCPQEECGRRVAILYERIHGDEEASAPPWACRTCLNLCYPVELEDRRERATRRMRKRRAKLGPGTEKPKRMRHETFVRLGAEYLEAVKECTEAHREYTHYLWDRMVIEEAYWDAKLSKKSGSPSRPGTQ
jgi:hypothetical protein